MRFILLSLFFFSTFTFISSTKLFVQPRADSNDFLVQLILNISEEKVPTYLIEVIYDRPLDKEVTTPDVFNLFQVHNLTIDSTLEILQALNISPDRVFSLNGLNDTLETLHWTFTGFYNSITTSLALTGTPLRDALLALQIDVTNFSSGITWGVPDPWSEFIRGTFTQATIEQACQAAGITVERLFESIRDLFVGVVESWEIQDFVKQALDHGIGRPEAEVIWNTQNISTEDVYNVELFRNILGNFSELINSHTSLGILTNLNNVYINRRSYEFFQNESELLEIHVETLLTNREITVNDLNDTIYHNIVVLSYDELPSDAESLTIIETGHAHDNLTDCDYITLRNNVIQVIAVEEATLDEQTLVIPRSTITSVVPGSPLVCNDTVYGLAREIVGKTIILDVFEVYEPDDDDASAAQTWRFGCQNGFVLIILYTITYIFRQ